MAKSGSISRKPNVKYHLSGSESDSEGLLLDVCWAGMETGGGLSPGIDVPTNDETVLCFVISAGQLDSFELGLDSVWTLFFNLCLQCGFRLDSIGLGLDSVRTLFLNVCWPIGLSTPFGLYNNIRGWWGESNQHCIGSPASKWERAW